MQSQVRLVTSFRSSGVFILDALPAGELQTARRLHEDVIHMKADDGGDFFHYRRTSTAADFRVAINEIRSRAGSGFKPIIHLEGHGHKDKGFQIADSGDYIAWKDLGELLRNINVLTRNHLVVVIAACQGAYQLDALDITRPCPFYFLVAAPTNVESGFIDDRMRSFYDTLLKSGSLDQALKLLTPHFSRFHSERYFCVAFARYLQEHCKGKTASVRSEKLLTELMQRGVGQGREQRRLVRRKLKERIRDPKADFYRKAHIFLHGRRTIKYEELHAFVRRQSA